MGARYTRRDSPLTYGIIGCAMAVHKQLGPGLSESVYEEALYQKLTKNKFLVRRQPKVRVGFEGRLHHKTFRPDLLVENEVIVEIKAVEALLPLHQAQLLTYMRLAQFPLGLLINFNVVLLKNGIKRLIMTKAP